ncbi:hypothetical protein GCK32_015245 [Trichostrongylus colubriformis]|uniref:Uncharacterized protein n=1 Tax=Trichostrongylus colubriformis TaxID=6319 RepID=A0AAN8IQM0_TRICO
MLPGFCMIFVFFFFIVSLILFGVFQTIDCLWYLVRHSNHGKKKLSATPSSSLSGSIPYFLGLVDDIIVEWKQLIENVDK